MNATMTERFNVAGAMLGQAVRPTGAEKTTRSAPGPAGCATSGWTPSMYRRGVIVVADPGRPAGRGARLRAWRRYAIQGHLAAGTVVALACCSRGSTDR